MSVPDENLTKCTLLVQKIPEAFIDYHTMLFPPPTSLVRQSMQERVDYDYYKSTKYYQPFFHERKIKYL